MEKRRDKKNSGRRLQSLALAVGIQFGRMAETNDSAPSREKRGVVGRNSVAGPQRFPPDSLSSLPVSPQKFQKSGRGM